MKHNDLSTELLDAGDFNDIPEVHVKYSFDVIPTGGQYAKFPIGLLTCDQCWPKTYSDAQLIASAGGKLMISLITLVSNVEPTSAAWKARGWTIISVTTKAQQETLEAGQRVVARWKADQS
jgi:hypothetical protein